MFWTLLLQGATAATKDQKYGHARAKVEKENKEGQRGRKRNRETECGIEATAAVCLTLEMV